MNRSPQFTPPSRFLHMYKESSTDRRMAILDSDKTTPVYILKYFGSKPQLGLCRPPTPSSALEIQIGSVSFHTGHDTVDLELGTHAISLEKGHLARSTKFQSSVGPLTWKYDSALGDDMRLTNATGDSLARFESKKWALHKVGKLEVDGKAELGPGLLDEIVLSAMATVVAKKRKRGTAGGVPDVGSLAESIASGVRG
ncbi:hypothetical protein MMC22_010399 [Lobaria immixta]|nr:hypothetical protein [Lobaria immixta]